MLDESFREITNIEFNKLVNDIRKKVKTLTKNFNYNEFQINLIVLVYLSMIMLDPKIADLIDETLSEVYIDFTTLSIEDDLKSLYPEVDFSCYKNISEWKGVAESDIIDNNGRLCKGKRVVVHVFDNLVYTIDTLIHELKHKINAIFAKFDGQVYYEWTKRNK